MCTCWRNVAIHCKFWHLLVQIEHLISRHGRLLNENLQRGLRCDICLWAERQSQRLLRPREDNEAGLSLKQILSQCNSTLLSHTYRKCDGRKKSIGHFEHHAGDAALNDEKETTVLQIGFQTTDQIRSLHKTLLSVSLFLTLL